MLIERQPPVHLTYCLNVHRGETWAENFAAIREHALAVRALVAPSETFGLGLRLSNQAARELDSSEAREPAKRFFTEHDLYAFTINGFPYGRFHSGRVKEQVYAPDWRTAERRDYTNLLADILADLLPDGMTGSISTVPGSFKPWIAGGDDVRTMAEMLLDCVVHLDAIRQRTGREIHLGLEPEPACFLETTDETIRFFNESLLPLAQWRVSEESLRRHLGVCFDTCHVALQFEELVASFRRFQREGIRISKVQISSALSATPGAEAFEALRRFCEPVYLHQVKARQGSGELLSWTDLPDALEQADRLAEAEQMRVHFHVPLFVERYGALSSTAPALTPQFFALLHSVEHLEIETYTFDVLPEELRSGGIVPSIAGEYEWVLKNLALNRPGPCRGE